MSYAMQRLADEQRRLSCTTHEYLAAYTIGLFSVLRRRNQKLVFTNPMSPRAERIETDGRRLTLIHTYKDLINPVRVGEDKDGRGVYEYPLGRGRIYKDRAVSYPRDTGWYMGHFWNIYENKGITPNSITKFMEDVKEKVGLDSIRPGAVSHVLGKFGDRRDFSVEDVDALVSSYNSFLRSH